ncbi:hypothetical protein [Natrarchaeobaculum sulfurireducens]|nr:hypothetical protein [Natrarchaeobaculum sulfurireducens]
MEQYSGRRHPQVFIRGQNYWFVELSDYWVEQWSLDYGPPGRQADNLLLAMNIQFDPGAFLTTTARYTHRRVMFDADWRTITRDGSLPSFLRVAETEPDHLEVDTDTVSSIMEALDDRSVFSTNLADHERDLINAIELYTDGLYSFDASVQWSYFWFCLENILGDGRGSGHDAKEYLIEQDYLSREDATKWKNAVDRIKHPDKGVDENMTDVSLPPPIRCREIASEVLLGHLL